MDCFTKIKRFARPQQQWDWIKGEIEVLKSGKFWREHTEKSASFLKQTATSRQNKWSITELRDPVTEEFCQEQHEISCITTEFYTSLFTPSSTGTVVLRALTRSILIT
ncbi:hypothetical protein CU098_006723 [Rhizopus stolonifer]|uniref:Uncharacterized protein n=1 Tax=Rhizopus stolonifer TaxID=4846 RepID=A0A367ITY0_RHIST|nr:hypothetical protein CU098_006723 [Rhizopus stolonifer]